jgi:hypothetical protein
MSTEVAKETSAPQRLDKSELAALNPTWKLLSHRSEKSANPSSANSHGSFDNFILPSRYGVFIDI